MAWLLRITLTRIFLKILKSFAFYPHRGETLKFLLFFFIRGNVMNCNVKSGEFLIS